MYQKFSTYLKKHENSPYKFILFVILIVISPNLFKILDHKFQKLFSLNRYINVIDFIYLGFFSFWYLKKDKLNLQFSKNLSFLVIFIVLARLSILFSKAQIHHRAYYDLFKISLFVFILMGFSTKIFQKHQKIVLKTLLTLFFSFALFQTIVAIFQFVLQKPLGLTFFHEHIFGQSGKTCSIYISKNAQFFLKYLPSQSNIFIRAHGTFVHPNVLSGFLNISSLLTLYFIYKSKNKVFTIFLFFQIIALILTFSRAGLASFVISSFCFFILMLYKKYNVNKMFLVFLLSFLVVGIFGSKQLMERGFLGPTLQSKQASLMNKQSDATRDSLKNVSINMIKKHPFLGVGFRNFLIKRNEYSNAAAVQRAYVHNIYLLIAAETGLISLIAFLAFLFFTFYETFRYFLRPSSIISICIVLSFLLIGFFDHYPIASNLGRIAIFGFLSFLNYLNSINKPLSYSRKAFLYQ